MEQEDVIEITTKTPYGEVTREFAPAEFAANFLGYYQQHGKAALDGWMEAHGITFDKALDLIGPDVMAQATDQQMAAVNGMVRRYKESAPIPLDSPEVHTVVDAAVKADSSLDQQRLKEFASRVDAGGVSDAELEQTLKAFGLLQHRSQITEG